MTKQRYLRTYTLSELRRKNKLKKMNEQKKSEIHL